MFWCDNRPVSSFLIRERFDFSIITGLAFGQQKAVTEMGEEVVLHEDGTWEYVDKTSESQKEIPVK